jgi:hypothetical protein
MLRNLKGIESLMVDRGWIEQVRNRWPIKKKTLKLRDDEL